MTVSEIELKFIVNSIQDSIDDVYYISNISLITKNSLVIKFHHSQKNDISLLVSTFGLCITRYKYSAIEDSDSLKKIKTELERSKLLSISVVAGERIVQFLFQNIAGKKYYLIIELFSHGNIIFCEESFKILNILNTINVRHRILKPGLKYFPPPSRGVDPFELNFDSFLSLANQKDGQENIDLKRWLGRNLSISKKFIDFVVQNLDFSNKKIGELTTEEFKILFNELITLIKEISVGSKHEPCIILDDQNNPMDISPVVPYNVHPDHVKKYSLYQDAIDEYLNYVIIKNSTTENTELEKQITSLEHDIHEQEKAKDLVISKSNKLRNFASLLMQDTDRILNIQKSSFQKLLTDFGAKIVSIKGKNYLEIVNENIPIDYEEIPVPKLSSLLFNTAKEMERGLITIENSHSKLVDQINKLQKQKSKKSLSEIRISINKEWYEKYRWFFTSDDMLAIGGRDSSSNSVLIRKHLTENDYVFHAEVHGSPFFILKNANNKINVDISKSISEVAQATVSFSRSWKDALSSSDAYWVYPNQIKKGAPTGQYLPKGAFIIEGKRNFVKNLEIKLSIGLSFINDRLLFIVGPYPTIKKRSICLRNFIPSGLDVVRASKKIKSDFVEYSIKNDFPKSVVDHLKTLSIDEIVRILPVGQFKLLSIEKGDLKYDFNVIMNP